MSLGTIEEAQAAWEKGEAQRQMIAYGEAYAQGSNKTMIELKAMIEAQTQLSVQEMFERNEIEPNKKILDYVASGRSRGWQQTESYLRGLDAGVYDAPDAPGAAMNGKFKNKGEFFRTAIAIAKGDPNIREKYKDLIAYSEQIPSEGGFLVPEEVRTEILTRTLEDAIVRPRAQVIPMPSGKLSYPAVEFTSEVGEVYGGIAAYWVGEGQSIPLSQGTFAAIELESNKLALRAAVPNELLRHAPAFNGWLTQNLPRAGVHFEDRALLKGDGVKKPLGQLHPDNPSLITVAAESGQTSGITWVNILTMIARFLPEALRGGVWIATPDSLPELMTMALPVGTGGSAVMAVNASAPGPQTLWGMSIEWSRMAPGTLNTTGDISLTNFDYYVIGDTLQMRVESSVHEQFSNDKTVFRAISEVDGQPQLLSSLTPENNGPALSATVQLATRS